MTEAIPFGSCCHARSGHALSLNWKEKTSSSQHGATNGHQPTVFSLAPASPILTPLLNAFKRFLFSRAMARNGNMFFLMLVRDGKYLLQVLCCPCSSRGSPQTHLRARPQKGQAEVTREFQFEPVQNIL